MTGTYEPYQRQSWVSGPNGGTPFSATRANHWEDGIEDSDIRNVASPSRLLLDELIDEAIDGQPINRIPLTKFYDVEAPPTDYTSAITAMLQAGNAARLPVYIGPGQYPSAVDVTDLPHIDLEMAYGAELLQSKGQPALRVRHSIDAGFAAVHAEAYIPWFSSAKAYEHVSTFVCDPADLLTVKAGDVMFYDAGADGYFRAKDPNTGDDTAAADFLSVNSDLRSYDAGYLQIRGFGVTFTGGGDIGNPDDQAVAMAAKDRVNNKTVKSSSGGLGVIRSSGVMSDGRKVYVLKTIAGTFATGDTLTTYANAAAATANTGGTAAGTVAANPFLIMAGVLDFNPANVTLHRTPRGYKTRLRVNVDAAGDVESITGSKGDRVPAIDLIGVIRAELSPRVRNGWSQAVRLRSTYRAYLPTVRVDGLPNNAYDTEQVFGYGVLETGGSEGTVIGQLFADNLRHGYTTGIAALPSFPTDLDTIQSLGMPKRAHIMAASITNSHAAGADTHGGGWEIRFSNMTVNFAVSLGQRETEAVGLQDRAFGTKVENLIVNGGSDGVRLSSHRYPAPAPYRNRYTNIVVDGHVRGGLVVPSTAAAVSNGVPVAGGTARTWGGVYEVVGLRTMGERRVHSAITTSQMQQVGVLIQSTGVRIEIRDFHASGFAYAPLLVEIGKPASVTVEGMTQDFTDSPSTAGPIRFDTIPDDVTLYDVRTRKGANALGGMLRVQGLNLRAKYGQFMYMNPSTATPSLPLLHPSGAGNATAVLTQLTAAVAA